MTALDLARRVRDLESLDRFAEADRLRWAAFVAAGGGVASEPDDDSASPLEAELRDAEAAEDWGAVERLLTVLAS